MYVCQDVHYQDIRTLRSNVQSNRF